MQIGNLYALMASCFYLLAILGCSKNSMPCEPISDLPAYMWAQINTNQDYIARAIVYGDVCPVVQLESNRCVAMEVRAQKEIDFPVLTCELVMPKNTLRAAIVGYQGRQALPLIPKTQVYRIAILGDTGCIQDTQTCVYPSWPFGSIAKQIASSQVDWVVHMGDYVYRHNGAAWDNWNVWEEDWFKPAHVLFATTPFVFIRGNHEQCKESYRGWFRFLSPEPYNPLACTSQKEEALKSQIQSPYVVQLGNMRMGILDSSAASDTTVNPSIAKRIKQDLKQLEEMAYDKEWTDVWLLTHRVLFGCVPNWNGAICAPSGKTLLASWREVIKEQEKTVFTKVVSGHVHLFGITDFEDQEPLQMIVGHGGAALNKNKWNRHLDSFGRTARHGLYASEFGYILLTTKDVGIVEQSTWKIECLGLEEKHCGTAWLRQNQIVR